MRKSQNESTVSKDTATPPGPQNAKERLYEKLRMPLPVLDAIIIVLVILLVVAFAAGMLLGRG